MSVPSWRACRELGRDRRRAPGDRDRRERSRSMACKAIRDPAAHLGVLRRPDRAAPSWAQTFLSEGFFGTATSWIIGLVRRHRPRGASATSSTTGRSPYSGRRVGYTLGAGLMVAIGITGFLSRRGRADRRGPGRPSRSSSWPCRSGWSSCSRPAVGPRPWSTGSWILLGRIQLEDISGGLGQGLIKDGVIGVGRRLDRDRDRRLPVPDPGDRRASMMASADISKERYRY